MKYYGFMVTELTGEIDNLECDCDYKPSHETCGFSFAKWFESKEQRDKIKSYTQKMIEEVRKQNNEIEEGKKYKNE